MSKNPVLQDHELTIHPAAELMPEMTAEEFAELKESIRKDGQHDSVIILENQILDGRHRFKACRELGKRVRRSYVTSFEIPEPYQYVIATNLHRRHLTAGQKATIALRLKDHYAKEAAERKRQNGPRTAARRAQGDKGVGSNTERDNCPTPIKSRARDDAAKVVGVSGKSVDRIEKVQVESPELAKAVESGKVSLNAAHKAVKTIEPSELKEVAKKALSSESPKKALVEASKAAERAAEPVAGPDDDRLLREARKALKRLSEEQLGLLLPEFGWVRRARKNI